MAKFLYRMQNILDIKEKLEETAKQEYAEARHRLDDEEEKLAALHERKQIYYGQYRQAIQGQLDFLEIESSGNAVDIIKEMIAAQEEMVRKRSKELEQARQKLNQVMQERKMHEKLKEKQFEVFKSELNAQESKVTDEVAGYQFIHAGRDMEE